MTSNKYTTNFTFYKNNYRLLCSLAVILLSIALILISFTFHSKFTKPTPTYFATTSDGRLIKITHKE